MLLASSGAGMNSLTSALSMLEMLIAGAEPRRNRLSPSGAGVIAPEPIAAGHAPVATVHGVRAVMTARVASSPGAVSVTLSPGASASGDLSLSVPAVVSQSGDASPRTTERRAARHSASSFLPSVSVSNCTSLSFRLTSKQ